MYSRIEGTEIFTKTKSAMIWIALLMTVFFKPPPFFLSPN